jgi:hypothetical protein
MSILRGCGYVPRAAIFVGAGAGFGESYAINQTRQERKTYFVYLIGSISDGR